MRLRLAKSKVIGQSCDRRGAAEGLKFSCLLSILNIEKCYQAASREMDRNCLIFADSRWEMPLKPIGKPLSTAKSVWKGRWNMPKSY
jgi:hypothetical protein